LRLLPADSHLSSFAVDLRQQFAKHRMSPVLPPGGLTSTITSKTQDVVVVGASCIQS
jgi:hypothetical protein